MPGKNKKKGKSNINKYQYKGPKNEEENKNVSSNSDASAKKETIDVKDALEARGINICPIDHFTKSGQTYPPTRPIPEIFPDKNFSVGEVLEHPLEINSDRKTSETAKNKETMWENKVNDVREGAEIHRQVRTWIQRIVRPGMRVIDICELLENKNRELIGLDPDDPFKRGIAFPTGVSLNNVAAHYTPNNGDFTVLAKDDIMKIDFGTHINGHIIDSAFTVTFDEKYDDFVNVVKEATNTGIREMGIDVRLTDIGAAVCEAMTADVDIGGTLYSVKPVRNLHGHNIEPYLIHGGKSVPIVENGDQTKMEEGELFAIETFGTTGKGYVKNSATWEDSHFMLKPGAECARINSKLTRDLFALIRKNFGTLAFCRRWVDRAGFPDHKVFLNRLVDHGVVESYPALEDKAGSFTAQYEHTIMLRPTCKEVVSRGFDY